MLTRLILLVIALSWCGICQTQQEHTINTATGGMGPKTDASTTRLRHDLAAALPSPTELGVERSGVMTALRVHEVSGWIVGDGSIWNNPRGSQLTRMAVHLYLAGSPTACGELSDTLNNTVGSQSGQPFPAKSFTGRPIGTACWHFPKKVPGVGLMSLAAIDGRATMRIEVSRLSPGPNGSAVEHEVGQDVALKAEFIALQMLKRLKALGYTHDAPHPAPAWK